VVASQDELADLRARRRQWQAVSDPPSARKGRSRRIGECPPSDNGEPWAEQTNEQKIQNSKDFAGNPRGKTATLDSEL